MKIDPYLTFDGQCGPAFQFYAKCLNGTLEAFLTFAETPACNEVPEDFRDKIIHARLAVGDQVIMGSDCPPHQPYEPIRGISVSINVDRVVEAERVFNALVEGGQVRMPLQKTFWAERFGMLVDRFGVPWMVNCEKDQ
ncbi:VOC family protein [Metapseudomonas boanensis]|uniref:VOC family protein n=1 Tax=Metapseudomonas boanensis TaxID=2822138 RepID=A0ABS5XLT0_9GAMM|nr:VOC family protein [Pseudomonas boanensis]MBT8768263.1 VOC family protein [Pseudomonas boanensis]